MAPPDPTPNTTPGPTPPKTPPWGLWILSLLLVLAVGGLLVLGLSPNGLSGLRDGLYEVGPETDGDRASVPGFLSIEPPQVYTRERLVNDRFREATWLNLQLEDTHAPEDRNRFAQASVAEQRARNTSASLAIGGGADASVAATAGPLGNVVLDELDLFQRRTVYRERLRNDLMDTLLDDGHDLDGNTLYRLNFDAVVLPWADRVKEPGTAIFVITARSPYTDLASAGIQHRRIDDDIDLLRSWQREIQVFLSEVLTLRNQSFQQQGTLINPVDPKENITFDWFLRTTMIEQFLRLAAKSGTFADCQDDKSYYAGHSCQVWTGRATERTEGAKRELLLRMDDIARWTGLDWRSDLPSPEASSPDVVNGLLRSLAVAQSVNAVRALSAPVLIPQGMPPQAVPPARALRFNQQTLQMINDPEQKRALLRIMATLEAMEAALPSYLARNSAEALPYDIGLNPRNPVAPPVNLGPFLARFGWIVPGHDEIAAYRDELEEKKRAVLNTERSLRADPNVPLPPPDSTLPYEHCNLEPTLFDFGRCMFLRVSTDSYAAELLANFLLARLTNDLTAYETLEQPITAFLDVRLSGCGMTGCKIEVRHYPGLTAESAGLKPFNVTDPISGETRRIEPFRLLSQDDQASIAAGYPVARLTRENIDILRAALSQAHRIRKDAMTCLDLAEFSVSNDRHVSPSEVYLACMLRQWVETKRSDLAVYGVSPRIRGSVEQATQSDNVSLNASGALPIDGATLSAGVSEANGSARAQVTANVIGFSQMSLGTQSDGSSNNPASAQDEALFGWAVRPNRASDGRHWAPSHNRLSAVVAAPSWWKWLEFEIQACWLTPERARAIAPTLHADPRAICTTPPPQDGDGDGDADTLTPTLERKFQVQLPRRVEDVTERFNFDFIKAPYFDRNWDDDIRDNPALLTLEVGRPGRLVLAGERLWRGTVVTVNNQNADGIVVLPDMKGVVAEFRCVQPPPGRFHMITDQSNQGDARPEVVPMLVWTSEGRTQVRQVFLQPFIKRTPNDAPCTDPAAYSVSRAGAPSAPTED